MLIKRIPDFQDYLVSDDGRVFSTLPSRRNFESPSRHTRVSPRELKKNLRPDGRYCVNLKKNGKQHVRLVARLILETFVGSRPEGKHACHGPLGKSVDSLSNVYWATPKQNNNEDKKRDGIYFRKLTPKIQTDIVSQCESGEKLQNIAQKYGVNRSTIHNVLRRHHPSVRSKMRRKKERSKNPLFHKELVSLYQDKSIPVLEIAKHFDLDRASLYKIIRREKLSIRRNHYRALD